MPLTPLLPGDPERLGAHRLLGRLGQGGMGTVFLGLDPTERAVAVKVLREGPADLEGRRRFRRELELLERVRGQHLVEVLGGDVEADPPWIATRFVPGQRLDDHVAQHGPLEEVALRRLADGLAEGLHALHRAGVVHRDLSPGNVLLVDGEPQVIDLGLAILSDVTSHTRTGLLLGTAGYLAPEQVIGETAGPASDVHAWGAVVAFAGTGRPPYGTGRPDAVLYRVVHAAPDLEGLPAPLCELVESAMSKDPQGRPSPAGLGRGLAQLPPVAALSHPPAPAPDVVDLLGPQATEVLGGATRVLGRELVVDLDARTTVLAPESPTQVLPARVPEPELDPGHRTQTRVLAVPPLPEPSPALPFWEPAPPAYASPAPPVAPPPLGYAAPEEPAPSPVERRRSTLQAWFLGVTGLSLIGAFARWAPLLTLIVAGVGLLVVQVAARSRQGRSRRLERKGPRGGDPLVVLLKLPAQAVLAAVDLLLALPLALAVAGPVTWLVSAGLPFGQGWLPQQGDTSEVRATALAVGLLVLVVLVFVPRRWRDSRVLLRRVATTPTPTTALLFGLAFLVLAVSLLSYAGSADVVWAPRAGPVFP